MDKTKTSKRPEVSSQKPKKELRLVDFEGVKRTNPLKDLADPDLVAQAVFECLLNNDPEGAMEMIEIYLEALNKTKFRKKTRLAKSTMYSALKHRNPTMKTLAKIMYASTH